jgi:hypothetical protein
MVLASKIAPYNAVFEHQAATGLAPVDLALDGQDHALPQSPPLGSSHWSAGLGAGFNARLAISRSLHRGEPGGGV